jgi:phospholipid/cholesterol/gamma-HCH transport system substrate-binding protein
MQEGGYVRPRSGFSFESLAQHVEGTASAIGDAARTAESAVGHLATPEVTENLRRITSSLASILEAIERGDGLAHDLLYDPAYAQRSAAILGNVQTLSAHASSASAHLDDTLARIERGPGTLHSLVYGEEGTQTLVQLQHAAAGIAELSDQLNHGTGLAASLLHDEAGAKLVHDLAELSDRLNRISVNIERGRGTLGGFVVDPSVYEDMKTVLGNIDRNVVFKALVRMTIKEDGIKRKALPAHTEP